MLILYLSFIDNQANREKFENLYFKHREVMFNRAVSILKDDKLAEDAVHDAFMKIITKLSKLEFESEHKERTFMLIVVENIAKDIYVRRKRERITDISEIDESATDKTALVDSADAVMQALGMVSKTNRDVLELHYVYDMTYADIGLLLGVPYETVKKRAQHGLKSLRKHLKKEGIIDE